MLNTFSLKPASAAFVWYKEKNELGVVWTVSEDTAWCWFHMGGTRAAIDLKRIETLSIWQVLKGEFSNNYAKASLMERHLRLYQGYGDITDLLDERHIRDEINTLIQENSQLMALQVGMSQYLAMIQPFITRMHDSRIKK